MKIESTVHLQWALRILIAVALLLPAWQAGHADGPPPLPVSIFDLQFTLDPGGGSPYEGSFVQIEGVVTATFFDGYTVAEAPGAWRAVHVLDWIYAPEIGDEVVLSGWVYENFGMTVIVDLADLQVVGGGQVIAPTVIGSGEVANEEYESVLVRVEDVSVVFLASFGEWVVADGTGYALVDDLNDYVYFPALGDELDGLAGIVFYSYGDFKIEPRNTQDIVTDRLRHYLVKGTVVTMNDARDVLPETYVEVLGDLIVALHGAPPPGLPVLDTGGLIFPGLIDAHNHPSYNVFDLLPFEQTFEHRDEWRATPLNQAFNQQYRGVLHYPWSYAQEGNMIKLAELRALAAGTTTMQGINCNSGPWDAVYAHQGLVIDNAERFPSLILSVTFPLSIPLPDWQAITAENWQRFVIHLSEGTNLTALQEFYMVAFSGLLDWRTAIIHGVALGSAEWAIMAGADAHLIWSPMSNWMLYGVTADVPGALAAGVNVALAPDWTPSGSGNLLAELQFADGWDDLVWGDLLDPLDLAEMVTRNAAFALASDQRIGSIAPGYRANLMVVPGDPARPYEALLEANPGSVMLTVASGRPMYGAAGLVDRIEPPETIEEIAICGTPKLFSVPVEAHGIDESDRPVTDILSQLTAAYEAIEPKVTELMLLADTSPPRLIVEGPECVPDGGGRLRSRVTVHAFDDCQALPLSRGDVVVRNGGGQIVNGNGVVDIEGNRVLVDTSGSGWSLEVSVTDSSGNVSASALVDELPDCGSQ